MPSTRSFENVCASSAVRAALLSSLLVLAAPSSRAAAADPTPDRPQVRHYRITLQLLPHERSLRALATMRVANTTQQPVTEIPFLLYRLFTVTAAGDREGRGLDWSQQVVIDHDEATLQVNHVRVVLPHALAPGDGDQLVVGEGAAEEDHEVGLDRLGELGPDHPRPRGRGRDRDGQVRSHGRWVWPRPDRQARSAGRPGGWPGRGNIDLDPLFAEPGRWVDRNHPDVVVSPTNPDAAWVMGDYHLKSRTGRWDPVMGLWVRDRTSSPCIDAGDPRSSVDLEPFPNGGIGRAAGVDVNCKSDLLFAGDANNGDTIVDVFRIGSNGALTPIAGSPFLAGVGDNSNVPLLSPDDRLLFVSNQNGASVKLTWNMPGMSCWSSQYL